MNQSWLQASSKEQEKNDICCSRSGQDSLNFRRLFSVSVDTVSGFCTVRAGTWFDRQWKFKVESKFPDVGWNFDVFSGRFSSTPLIMAVSRDQINSSYYFLPIPFPAIYLLRQGTKSWFVFQVLSGPTIKFPFRSSFLFFVLSFENGIKTK